MPAKSVSLVRLAQQLITQVINKGDVVVDATAGNGHDTLFLSKAVGPQGKVYGFDIQTTAIENTRRLLEQHNCIGNICLTQSCHSKIGSVLQTKISNHSISAAMFNLGYLPGANKTIITKGNTTIAALNSLLPLLSDNACVTILAYRGHPGGKEEADIIAHYCTTLDANIFHYSSRSVTHTNNIPPILFSIIKSPHSSPSLD